MTTMKANNLYIDGKAVGAVVPVAAETEMYFGVQVSQARALFLMKMLDIPLCDHCCRELDECDGDPCVFRRVKLGEIANCNKCFQAFDPHHLNEEMICPQCEKG